MREFEVSIPIAKNVKDIDFIKPAAKALGVSEKLVGNVLVIRKSIDARGDNILLRIKAEAYLKSESVNNRYVNYNFKNVSSSPEVIVVGAGPAGLFAALKLIEKGLKPIIVERGKDIHERKIDIAKINREQIVNPDSNYSFGEGGAGTFSDGKLYTRSAKRGNVYEVLSRLVDAGADSDIMVDAHPHIGSDKLPSINEKIRELILSCGGEYHFNSRVTGIIDSNGEAVGVTCSNGMSFKGKGVILATGHSARDIYRMFHKENLALEQKGFALGVRVEHQQSLINTVQYHGKYQPYMPNAEYSLVTQEEGRGVFSFCMCPGGILVPASTSPGELVLNGMSNSQRNSRWANSGIVVSINPGDIPEFDKFGILSLLELQSSVERSAFEYGGGNLVAPAQRITDFVKKKVSASLPASSYFPGAVSAPLNEILPEFVYSRMRMAMIQFNRKIKGFVSDESLMLAVESRTSSPLRIPRDPVGMEHLTLKRLYPCGEGAGYAGGIVSSALDGINAAEAASAAILK